MLEHGGSAADAEDAAEVAAENELIKEGEEADAQDAEDAAAEEVLQHPVY